MRPTPDEQVSIANVAKGHVRFTEFIQRWKTTELERLPSAMTGVERMQGRCQILGELHDSLQAALEKPTKT